MSGNRTAKRQQTREPIAFFLTWTTYGSWLPGDDRGWVSRNGIFREPDKRLQRYAANTMRGQPIQLAAFQQRIVEAAIRKQCDYAHWQLHAANCRTNHVHVVVSAANQRPADVLGEIKAWSSRMLSERLGSKTKWWSRGGSRRLVFDESGLEATVLYVRDAQDKPRF